MFRLAISTISLLLCIAIHVNTLFAQQHSGIITDAYNQAIIGAHVNNVNSLSYAYSDEFGQFVINQTNTGDTLWPTHVQKIYFDIIQDLSLRQEQVPLIAGELVAVEGSCCSSMNAIIQTLPDYIKNAYVVSSKGCTAMDNAHFDSQGYREMGKRYAEKILSLH